ncbi:unnamed protein product, partial [Nesidiocoris tenuis]
MRKSDCAAGGASIGGDGAKREKEPAPAKRKGKHRFIEGKSNVLPIAGSVSLVNYSESIRDNETMIVILVKTIRVVCCGGGSAYCSLPPRSDLGDPYLQPNKYVYLSNLTCALGTNGAKVVRRSSKLRGKVWSRFRIVLREPYKDRNTKKKK